MWTKEESDLIQKIAKETVPGVKTMAIPHGLQVERGPDAIVEFLKEKWGPLVGWELKVWDKNLGKWRMEGIKG